MKIKNEHMILYAVTDRAWLNGETLYSQVEAALKGGVTCVQLREKELDNEHFLSEAFEIKKLCQEYNVPFLINDNVDIAIKCGADGVHVGQSDMAAADIRKKVSKDFIIGVSAQTVEQAEKAVAAGADYLGVGAVFPTSTKLDADWVSPDTLKAICDAVDVPVVAIGGINKNNILSLSGSGVQGVALVSAIFAAKNIQNECRELKDLSERMVNA